MSTERHVQPYERANHPSVLASRGSLSRQASTKHDANKRLTVDLDYAERCAAMYIQLFERAETNA
jgi:hypothetical protein